MGSNRKQQINKNYKILSMQMTEDKAFEIIEQMITNAKREAADNGFYFMLWGYLVFISALIDYFLLIANHPNHTMVWGILMPLGGVVSIIMGRLEKKKQKVTTYVDEVLKHVMVAYVVCLLIVCLIMPISNNNWHWRSFYPTLMIVYGFGLYATGGIIKFKPLQFGAISIWLCAIAAYFVTYDWQLLCLATAVLSGFIVPGHMLNLRFKRNV